MVELHCDPLSEQHFTEGVMRLQTRSIEVGFPSDIYGGSTKAELAPSMLMVRWRDAFIETDIGTYAKAGGSRGFLRHRGWFVRAFYSESGARAGDVVVFERLGEYEFRLHLEKPDGTRVDGAPTGLGLKTDPVEKWAKQKTRPEQQKFRRDVAARDGLRCSISGCTIAEVLDAAHVIGKSDGGVDAPENGFILRADLHRLFDSGLLEIDPDTRRVKLHTSIADFEYRLFEYLEIQSSAEFDIRIGQTNPRS